MDLELSEEQRQTVETIRRFLEKEIKPHVERWDHQNEYPTEARDAFKEMGLYGAIIPTEYGGLGWDTVTYALVITELAACWMTLSSMINTQMIMAHSVLDAGTEEQKKKWLPKMATGEMRGGLALSEAHGGSDVAGMLTTAKKDGDVYRINGSKMWITNSDGNSFFLLAKTDTTCSPPHGGISGFIMETGAEGFKVSRDIPKLGLKGIPTSELSFEDFPVPAENLLGGKEGQGFVQVMRGLELGRINVAARSVGVRLGQPAPGRSRRPRDRRASSTTSASSASWVDAPPRANRSGAPAAAVSVAATTAPCSAVAICAVSRSWICSRLAKPSTRRASLLSPTTRPFGR